MDSFCSWGENMRANVIEGRVSFVPAKKRPPISLRQEGAETYNWLLSLSQLGRGRILMPDTSPMAINSVRVDEPP